MENPNGNYLETIKNGMVLKFEDLKDDFWKMNFLFLRWSC